MNTRKSPTTAKPETTPQNRKSGSEVAQWNSTEPLSETASVPAKARRTLPRTHADYWKSRLFRRSYAQDGIRRDVNDLYVRIQYGGRREFLPLSTTNQDAAARKAASLYTSIVAKGWDAALADAYKDSEAAAKLEVSVGDYLGAVDATRRLRARTFLNYRNCLRTVVAESFGIRPKKGENKFDYLAGGNKAWTKRIDEIRLERLTPERVNRWKRERIASAGHAPAAIASARRTVNSYLRCARSLFSPSLVRKLKGLKLPAPLPFDGVELEKTGSQKYVSKINAQTLIAAAKNELKAADPEAYKAFLLGLFAGMRKAEIDSAEWRMVDFAANVIHLEETEWLHLKTEDAAAAITVDPEVIAELRALMPAPTDKPAPWSQFILQSPRPPRPDSIRPYYRAEETFDRFNTWLRKQGVQANKPLHELRKELGAIIATEHGIFAASKFLRHSDITTTARHYADQKARINVGLGRFLDTEIKAVPQPAQAATA